MGKNFRFKTPKVSVLVSTIVVCLLSIVSNALQAQCYPNTVNRHAGTWHSNLYIGASKTSSTNVLVAWGESSSYLTGSGGATGTVFCTPTIVSASNYSGIPIEVRGASSPASSGNNIFLLRTEDLSVPSNNKIYLYGDGILPASFGGATLTTSASDFSAKLPTGVTMSDIAFVQLSPVSLAIVTKSAGNVYITGTAATSILYGDNSATASNGNGWHKVLTASGVALSGVNKLNLSAGGAMALSGTKMYFWGLNAYIPTNNTTIAKTSTTYAKLINDPNVTAPYIPALNIGETIIDVIALGNGGVATTNLFYLTNKGRIYANGANGAGELGNGSATSATQPVFTTVSFPIGVNTTSNPIVKMDASNESSTVVTALGAMDKNGNLYTWGDNNGNMIGGAAAYYATPQQVNFVPNSTLTASTSTVVPINDFTIGGHFSAGFDNTSDAYWYLGHFKTASMGAAGNDPLNANAAYCTLDINEQYFFKVPNTSINFGFNCSNALPTATISTSNLTGFTACSGSVSSEKTFTLSAANLTDNLVLDAPIGYEISTTSGTSFVTSMTLTPTSGTVASTTIYVRLKNDAINGASGNIEISSTNAVTQNVATGVATITSCSVTPTISTTGTTSAFITCLSTASSSQSISLTASNLTADVTVLAPAGFEISNTQTGTYSNTLTVSATGGSVSATSIWVRLTGSTAGTFTGTVNFTSADATTQNLSVSGTVNATSVAGTISGTATVCSGTSSKTITLSGNTGTIQWQSSINGTTFNDLTGQVSSTLTTGTLTQTTYYRANVTSGSCSSIVSGTATITVSPLSFAGTISGTATVCSGTSSKTITLTGNTGTIQWQSSINGTTFNDVTGQVSSTLTTGTLTQTTYFRANVTSGSCSSITSGTATITVTPLSVGGTIAGSAAVCSGTNSTTLTLSGNTGSVIKWQSSTAADFSGTVTDIANTTTSLTATNLSTTAYYRAVVQSESCTVANSGTASITVTNCVEAKPDNNSTSVSVPVTGNVSTNDIITSGTTYGTPTPFNTNPTDATITMDPATGIYTFTATKPGKYAYYVSVCAAGQNSNCPITLLQITVLDPTVPNNPPVANSDIATTNLNTAVTTSILANDKSGNIGTTLVPSSVTIVTQPKNGIVVVNADGTLTYTPTTGYTGKDSLVYNVCDNASPANCQSTSVYYKILDAGAASVTSALDDYAYTTNNKTGTASVSGNVLTNDKNTAAAALTVSLITGPTAAQGTLTLNADGTFTFVPTLGFSGPIDVVYNACTSDIPAVCAKATLHIVVTPPPTINPDFNSTNVNIPVLGSINTNDIIPAGTTYGTPVPSNNNPTGATISLNASTGTYTFTASKPGKYIFQVPVCAASQTTGCPLSPLQITVLDPNSTTNPPVANNDYSSTKLNTPVTTLIIANDKSGNVNTSLVPTSIFVNTAPKNGTGRANISTTTSISTLNSLSTVGTITYTPNNGYSGLDSLVYTVCDNASPANCEVATVYYTISTATPNDVLVANDDYNTSTNRIPAIGNLLLNDNYGGAVLASTLVTGPTVSQGVFELSADGMYKFIPAFGFTGPVDIIYKACADTTCINATLHVLVNLVPPPPPTVMNATYVAGSRTNPTDIKSLVTVTPVGTTIKWCDPTGTTCTTTPPTLPTTPGTFIWCVKSVDIVTLLSSTCAMDTVVILAPYTVMEVTKSARSVKTNPDGSVLLTFVMKAANKTNAQMDSVSIKDDLSQTFRTTTGFSIAGLDVYGGLVKNAAFDGVQNIDLVTNQSKIAANTMDSVILKVLVASPSINGNLTNVAVLGGKTKYGFVSVNSNDPVANPSDTNRRAPTPFIVPKADLIIAGGFSPNNDGFNDRWIIVRPFGTTIKVKVFNRWGNIVYENENYKNDWDGRGQKNFMGEFIPEGTYFYVVNAVDASGNVKNFASSITVVR